MGIDLFGTTQKMSLTNQPQLTTADLWRAAGHALPDAGSTWGRTGTVPFFGVLTGPVARRRDLRGAEAPGDAHPRRGRVTAGATMHLSPQWGVCLEYRFVLARGAWARQTSGWALTTQAATGSAWG